MFENSSINSSMGKWPNRISGTYSGRRRYVFIMDLADPEVLWICTAIVIILVVLGLFGNSMALIILRAAPKRTSSNFYLQALAVADSSALIFLSIISFIGFVIRPLFPSGSEFMTYYLDRWIICQINIFLSYWSRGIATYIIVLFTVERCITVIRPLRASSWFSVRRSQLKVAIVCILAFALAFPGLFTKAKMERRPKSLSARSFVTSSSWNNNTDGSDAEETIVNLPPGCRTAPIFYVFIQYNLICLSLIPTLVVVVCNIIIVAFLRRRSHDHDLQNVRRRSFMARQETNVTKRLLLVSTMFVLLTTPVLIMSIYLSTLRLSKIRSKKTKSQANGLAVCMTLWLTNYAINFSLYCMTNRQFREMSIAILSCNMQMTRQIVNHRGVAHKPHLIAGPDMPLPVECHGDLHGSPSVGTRSTFLTTSRTSGTEKNLRVFDSPQLNELIERAARSRSSSPNPIEK